MRLVATFMMFVLLPRLLAAQSVRSFAVPDSLTTGATFEYIITAQYQANRFTPIFPDSSAFSGDIEFRSVQRYRGVQSRDSVVYQLQFFALQDTTIDPVPIIFNSSDGSVTVQTPPVNLYFVSLLDESATELRDLKPLFIFTRSWFWVTILGLALLITGYLLYRYRGRFAKQEPQAEAPIVEVPPFVNPLLSLQEKLAEIRGLSNTQEDNFREFYTQISDAFRAYFEEVYFIPALESTTKEVLRDLKRKGVGDQVVLLMNSLLKESDMVKFAKYHATEDQAIKSLHQADQLFKIIQRTDYDRINQLRISHEMKYNVRAHIDAGNKMPLITNRSAQ